jgi:hypothetical protein
LDAAILARTADRSVRIQAPERGLPTGRWGTPGSLEQLLSARGKVIDFARSADYLRDRVQQHPVLGLLDGHQWLLAVGAHTERHTKQIREVKACATF